MKNMMKLPSFKSLVLSLLMVTLLLSTLPSHVATQASEFTARRFCVNVLKQSKYDATQCLLKPAGYKIARGKDQAVLTYLCCLGAFSDVTHNYMPSLSNDLLMYITNIDSASTLLNLGTFVGQCSRRAPKITRRDYSYWSRMGRSARFCKSPWTMK